MRTLLYWADTDKMKKTMLLFVISLLIISCGRRGDLTLDGIHTGVYDGKPFISLHTQNKQHLSFS